MWPGERPRSREHGLQHGRSQTARVGVLTARMKRGDDVRAAGHGVVRAVGKRRTRPHGKTSVAEDTPAGVEGDAPEADHHANVRKCVPLRLDERPAALELLGGRPVVWWRAPRRRDDVRTAQSQSIVRASRRRLRREAIGVQRAHQKVSRPSRTVAGEHAAGAIGAMRRRGEADEKDTRVRVAEAWYRSSPIRLIAKRGLLDCGNLPTVLAQARAALTRDDRLVDGPQCPADGVSRGRRRGRLPARGHDTSCARAGPIRRARIRGRGPCA